jgi:ribose 5-phosphate isomerase B
MAITETQRAEILRRVVGEVARRTFPAGGEGTGNVAPSPPLPRPGVPAPGWTSARSRPLVTADALRELAPGSTFRVPDGAVLTPLARDLASDRRISLVPEGSAPEKAAPAPPPPAVPPGSRIALGADHAGFRMKEDLRAHLGGLGYSVRDFGTTGDAPVDYPDFARPVAEAVARGDCAVGILVDGAGVGSAIAANKVPGVRAAPCPDVATARNAREHNFANVLCLPSRGIDEARAREILAAFLGTATGGERHARRVAKIAEIERSYLRPSAVRPG